MKEAVLIGIGGGTGSGKTYFSKEIKVIFRKYNPILINQDSYYNDQKNIPFEIREKVNYDHPDAFDYNRLLGDLLLLKKMKEVAVPIYDYKTHLRIDSKQTKPSSLVIVEGILALHFSDINRLFSYKAYISTPEKTRLKRRIKRDTKKRGRTEQSVIDQFNRSVKVMHNTYVAKTKKYSDIIIADQADKNRAVEDIKNLLEQK